MADHAVIRTDLMSGTNVNAGLRSFKYMGAGSTATDIDNGCVVKLDGILDANEREVWKAVTPAANTPLNQLAIVATPELHYDERKHALKEFYNAAGKICRGYTPHSRDIFSVTAEALDGVTASTAVGAGVELQASVKLKVNASAASPIGKLIAIEDIKGVKFYVIEIL